MQCDCEIFIRNYSLDKIRTRRRSCEGSNPVTLGVRGIVGALERRWAFAFAGATSKLGLMGCRGSYNFLVNALFYGVYRNEMLFIDSR